MPVPSRTETVFEPWFVTARSGRPSALTSATATEVGIDPVGKSAFVRKLPVPVPSRTEAVFAVMFATARSGCPSALRSAMATENGFGPVGKSVFVPRFDALDADATGATTSDDAATVATTTDAQNREREMRPLHTT